MATKDLSIANAPRPELAPDAQQAVTSIAAARAKKNASSSTTPVITPNSLAPQVVPQVSTPPIPTAQAKMAGEFQVQAEDALQQKVAADSASAKTSTSSALDSYLSTLGQSRGLTTLTADAYATPGGVNAITPELNEINSKIQKEQLALRRSIEAIQTKGGGLKGGAQAEIANLERDSFAKQADLSVIQMAIQGRYDSAKEIADRAVAAKFEEQTQKTAIAKFDYTENKDLFDKAEQREFDLLFSDRERQLEEAKANSSAIYDLGLQASQDGAPSSVVERMMAAKTKEEALALGGSYIGALDRRAQEANIAQSVASTAASWASVRQKEVDTALSLFESGDPSAINKLGYNPAELNGGVEGARNYEVQKADIQMGLGAASALLKNMDGIKLSSGAFQSPFLTAAAEAVGGGSAAGAVGGSVVPGVGTLLGAAAGAVGGLVATPFFYSRTKTAKDEALASASFLINDITFQEIRDLKASGVTFGNMTEGERIAAGRAASLLASAAIIDASGMVTGFRGSDKSIKGYVEDIQKAYEGRQEYTDALYAVKPEEQDEAKTIWNSN